MGDLRVEVDHVAPVTQVVELDPFAVGSLDVGSALPVVLALSRQQHRGNGQLVIVDGVRVLVQPAQAPRIELERQPGGAAVLGFLPEELLAWQTAQQVLHVVDRAEHLEQLEQVVVPREEDELVKASRDVRPRIPAIHAMEVGTALGDRPVVRDGALADPLEVLADPLERRLRHHLLRDVAVAGEDVLAHLGETLLVLEDRSVIFQQMNVPSK